MAVLFSYTGSGGLTILPAPSRNYNAKLDFALSFTYLIYGTGDPDVNISISSQWEVSAGKRYWYRVLLYCQSPNFNPSFAIDDTLQGEDVLGFNINPNIYDTSSYCSRSIMRPVPLKLGGFAQLSSFIDTERQTIEANPNAYELIDSNSDCDRLQGYTISPDCAKRKPVILVVVAARDLSEVCQKLKRPRLGPPINFRICSIKKFITPINESAGHGIKTELEDQDFSNVPECLNYNLDYDLTKISNENLCNNAFIWKSFVYRSFYHQTQANISISGSSEVEYAPITSSGYITFYSADPDLIYSTFVYPEPEDYLSFKKITKEPDYNGYSVLYGESECIINPLIRNCSGSLSLGGAIDDIVAPIRKYKALGSIEISSNSNIALNITNDSYCLVDLSGSASIVFRNKFHHDAVGGLGVLGEVEIVSNRHFYQASGSAAFSNELEVISGYRFYKSEGAITLSGNFSQLGRCVVNSESDPSIIYLSGSFESSYIYAFDFNGGINLGGITKDLISMNRNYSPSDNNLYITGDSEINFTNFGLLVAYANFYSNYSNASIEVLNKTFDSNITLPTGLIESCGCSAGLTVDLLHNIGNGGVISEFIKNNSSNFNPQITLKYRSKNNSWLNTQTLVSQNISWQFIFELTCTNIIENQVFDQNYLKFNFYAKYRNSGTFSVSNLIVYINPDSICARNGVLSTSITRVYNSDANEYSIAVDSVPVTFYKFFDNIGIFSNKYWNNKLNYGRLRPQYYDSTTTYNNPKTTGVWPEFRLNFTEAFVSNIRTITI